MVENKSFRVEIQRDFTVVVQCELTVSWWFVENQLVTCLARTIENFREI